MKPDLTNDALHNPFKNRFNDPVTWRLDEMQAHSNVLRARAQSETDFASSHSKGSAQGMFASAFTLFIVVLATVFVLIRG